MGSELMMRDDYLEYNMAESPKTMFKMQEEFSGNLKRSFTGSNGDEEIKIDLKK